MKKTETLGLNQWELSDPIRMEDFNADNAAVEAALKAVSGPSVRLIDKHTPYQFPSGNNFEFYKLAEGGVDWGDWTCVAVLFIPEGTFDTGDTFELRVPMGQIFGTTRIDHALLTLFFPNRDSATGVNGIALGKDAFTFQSELPFSDFGTLRYGLVTTAGHDFTKATFITLGLR